MRIYIKTLKKKKKKNTSFFEHSVSIVTVSRTRLNRERERDRERATFDNWTASSEFGAYRLCEQRRLRRACAFAQSRQSLRCSLIQAVSEEEPSDRKPDPWAL